MKAHLRDVRISMKKANVVAGIVRGMSADKALIRLQFLPKKAAKVLYKVLHSAVANAEHNSGKSREELKIKHIIINRGTYWKRFLPSTRGRALPLRKPTSHITVELESADKK